MKVTLTVHGQEHDGQTFVFTEPGSMLFGRSEKAQCRIANDPYVSRAHFLLLINPPDVRLRNLSQTNGTELDGKSYKQTEPVATDSAAPTLVKGHPIGKSAEAVVRNGSQIEVGYTRISVAIEQPPQVYCGDCGSAIPASQKAAAVIGEFYLCAGCREKRRREHVEVPRQGRRLTPGIPIERPEKPRGPVRRHRDPLEKLILRQLGAPAFRGIVRDIPDMRSSVRSRRGRWALYSKR